MLNQLRLTNCICYYGQYVFATEKSLLEKTDFTVANSYLFYIELNLFLVTVGLDNQFEYSTPFALVGF